MNLSRQRIQQLVRPSAVVYSRIKVRANGVCERCGVRVAHGHVHHLSTQLDKFFFNGEKNLQYLCLGCHRLMHTGAFNRKYIAAIIRGGLREEKEQVGAIVERRKKLKETIDGGILTQTQFARMGGLAQARKLSKKKLSADGREAARARWRKRKNNATKNR